MINQRQIEISNYDYALPDERIAKYPMAERDQSKLLVFGRLGDASIEEHHFCDLPGLVPAGSMMVFNDTRVIQARLHFRKPTGGIVEVFCLEPSAPRDYQQSFAATSECVWTCLVGNSKKWKEGALRLTVDVALDGQNRSVTLCCERVSAPGASQEIRFFWEPTAGITFAHLLDAMGELPIPPYLNRATEESDKETYQTVYSRIKGSVAAPTAGLHYTPRVLDALKLRDVSLNYLTLHVGAGTFKPVKSATIEGHDMHTEFIAVERQLIADIIAFKTAHPMAKSAAEPLFIATGTTSVRTLESLYYIGAKLYQLRAANLAAGREAFADVQAEALVVHQWDPYESSQDALPLTESLRQIVDYLDAAGSTKLVTSTQILIAPGFRYRIIDALVTNFHMPQSTLLLLVSALTDGDDLTGKNWHTIYRYALDHDFRFLSYGDSSMLFVQH